MSQFFNSGRMPVFGFTVMFGMTLLVACGDRHSMAMKSQEAFEDAQKKGLPIDKGGHGGHENMDMSGSKQGDMKGMDMSGSKQGDMKGMDMSGSKQGDMKGMDMSGSKQGDMKGMDMSGSKHGDMKGMDMSGMEMSPVVPQPKALQAKPGETAATLQADPLDAPASSSIASARQSGDMNMSMGSDEGMSMSMNSYVQHDVGRDTSSSDPMKGMNHDMPGMKMDKSAGHDMPGMKMEEMPGMKMDKSSSHQMPGMKMDKSSSHQMPGMKHEPAVRGPKTSAGMYVCASHPEIVRDQPGKCPIDGTPLVKKEKK